MINRHRAKDNTSIATARPLLYLTLKLIKKKKKVITRRSSPKVAIALAGLFDTIMIHELKQELKDNYYFH